MPLNAPKAQRILPPEGTHMARCIRLIQVGTIMGTYMGEEQEQNKLDLTFELSQETHVFKEGEEAKPFVVSQEYTLSMGKKAKLRTLVEGMIGKSLTQEEADLFDLTSLVNMPCLLTIKYQTSKTSGNQYVVVASASPLMKGQEAPDAYNEPKLLTYEKWDTDYFKTLPQFMQEKIKGSREFKDKFNGEDIPF